MPSAVTELPPRSEPRGKLWTRAEVDALSSIGLFDQQKFEVVEGEWISTIGKLPPHGNSLVLLRAGLTRTFGDLFIYHEYTIDVAPEDNPTNAPEPRISRRPIPARTTPLIDRSIGFDARLRPADRARRRMIVHRDPRDGRYTSVVAYNSDELVAPLAASESPLRVKDAFPG